LPSLQSSFILSRIALCNSVADVALELSGILIEVALKKLLLKLESDDEENEELAELLPC
jgi:hypothetical protein